MSERVSMSNRSSPLARTHVGGRAQELMKLGINGQIGQPPSVALAMPKSMIFARHGRRAA